MTLAVTYAPNITAFNATPSAPVRSALHGGYMHKIWDQVAVPILDDSELDRVVLARLPVRAILTKCRLKISDLGDTATLDLGFWKTDAGTGVALDDDALAAAIDVNGGATDADYRFTTLAVGTWDDEIWDLATLSAVPDYDYIDIAMRVETGDSTATGTCLIDIEYML